MTRSFKFALKGNVIFRDSYQIHPFVHSSCTETIGEAIENIENSFNKMNANILVDDKGNKDVVVMIHPEYIELLNKFRSYEYGKAAIDVIMREAESYKIPVITSIQKASHFKINR